MLKKILPITLLSLIPVLLMAYTVVVEGFVYSTSNQGLAGVEVTVFSAADDAFQYKETLVTDDAGHFRLSVEVPDDVEKGTLFFTVAACNTATQTRRVAYSPGNATHSIRVHACKDPNACRVKIQVRSDDTGQIILTAKTGDDREYKFEWSTGETTSEIIANDRVEYCVTVTSGDGCQARDCVDLSHDRNCKTEIHVSRPDPADVGAYILTARTKGHAPFSYFWSTDEATEQIKVTDPGEYCVRVVDALGCESNACIVIGGEDCETKIQVARLTPNIDALGVKLIARTKGRAPFRYVWSTGETTEMIQVFEPGEYCVKVLDVTGCESSDCITIDPREDCKTQIVISPNFDSAIASAIHLTARTYGRPPFKYRWSTGDTTKSIRVTDLKEYCVEVIDANQCVSDACIDLSQLNDTCSVSIHRTASGNLIAQPRGLPPFTFEWSTGATGRVTRIDGAGEYCVTVTNAFGCTARACITVEDGSDKCRVKIHRNATDALGSVKLVAEVKGEGDFEFEWSTGETSKSIIVDASGVYWVIAFNSTCRARDEIKVQIGNGVSVGDAGFELNQQNLSQNSSVAISASPNPTVGDLRVVWESLGSQKTVQIAITSARGELVWLQEMTNENKVNDTLISMSDFTPGLYFVQIRSAENSKVIKVLKQ
ncbi:MAG: T9SS type A sorting domain-containing protein [Saprospiraceae bacterium]|nr:T9SS type A sorting domain-containing protein [Saprospiraceae bacterium]